jgi:hypothetical protein
MAGDAITAGHNRMAERLPREVILPGTWDSLTDLTGMLIFFDKIRYMHLLATVRHCRKYSVLKVVYEAKGSFDD